MKSKKQQKKQDQTILIIDDDPSILMSFKFLLTQAGHAVITRNSGRKGIDTIKKKKRIHIAFIDINMPDLNGIETHKVFQEITPQLPCILMANYTEQNHTKMAIKERPYGIIYKPFDVEEVMKLIHDISYKKSIKI